MIKNYSNEHPKSQRIEPERVDLAEVTKFNFKDFNKYKNRVYKKGENLKKVFPDGISERMLMKFLNLIEKK